MSLFNRDNNETIEYQQTPIPFDNQEAQGLSLPLLAQQSADLMKWVNEPGDILEEVEHSLKGEFKINGEWKKCGKQLLTDDGIKDFIGKFRTRLNKNFILGNRDSKEIKQFMYEIETEIIFWIAENFDKHNIQFDMRDTIKNSFVHNCEMVSSRSKDGTAARQLSQQSKRLEQVVHNNSGTRKASGGFKSLFGA